MVSNMYIHVHMYKVQNNMYKVCTISQVEWCVGNNVIIIMGKSIVAVVLNIYLF